MKRVPRTSVSNTPPRIRTGLSNMLSDSIAPGYELVVVALTTATYVVTTSHVSLYFSQNRKGDSRAFRLMVFTLWFVDTCCTAVISHSASKIMDGKMCIHSRKSPSPYPWTFALENACFMMFAIQGFFIIRTWIARSVKQQIHIGLITVALCALAASIVLTIKPFPHRLFSTFSGGVVGSLICVGVLAFTTTFDIVITIVSCYCLGTKRDRVVQWISKYRDDATYYVCARLIITGMVQAAAIITYCLVVKKDVWMLGHLALSKVYVNNILAIINSRLDDPHDICEYLSEKVEILFVPIEEDFPEDLVVAEPHSSDLNISSQV
ncbi:uncharacterized protein EV420DRAFT_106702 [Desarmillaria tabescens]|uniref:Glucose receptor Git3 N-terminal domain-containing protein n=1 Tax=Armillaria tabescens TaxID=1929756 RepID=A0AA39NR69_ARMTA|nr:uncharacterized protein EV420DRAFT_106702 [Desarmillaria tabescens]KAK0470328.1 hypothetical protein EV420DRAFT_106702 [Desarmillaria tabescens]